MNEKDSKETRSYRDPMASRVEAAEKRREALLAKFPSVKESYDGFYVMLDTLTADGTRYFLGAEGIIGTELTYSPATNSFIADDGRVLAQLEDKFAQRLATYSQGNWRIKAFTSATFFKAKDKTAAAEVAFICWAPLEDEQNEAMETFSRNIAHRLSSGDRAGLRLSQEQLINVLRSNGDWYLTKATKRDALEKGTVIYKSKQGGNEKLTSYALKHKTGCNIIALAFWALLIVGAGALIWFLFFQ